MLSFPIFYGNRKVSEFLEDERATQYKIGPYVSASWEVPPTYTNIIPLLSSNFYSVVAFSAVALFSDAFPTMVF